MGQVTLFLLFVITLIVGAFAYFLPKHQAAVPVKVVMDSGYDTPEDSSVKKSQQLDMMTDAGGVQIHRQIDDLTRKQNDLMGVIDYEQQALKDTSKKIAGTTDVLKLKALGLELQNDQRLLVEHGRQWVALNDQINKNRRLIAEERDLVNTDSASQSAELIERVKEQVDEERQKALDQQNR